MGTADFYRDKRILIFGASGGLGQELARQLALRGAARLYLSGRREAALRTLAEELRAKGAEAEILPCDVTHPEALAACIGRAAAAGLDGAFIACGVAPGKSADGLEEPEDIARCLAVNTAAPAEAMVLLCRCWERTGGAHFLSVVTSQAGLLPLPYVPVYAASKAGLNAFGEGLRDRLRTSGTALTLVMPGFFDSPMGRRFRGRKWFVLSAAEAAEKTLDGTARGRERCIFPRALHGAIVLAQVLPRWLVRPVMGLFAFETLPEEHTET